MLFGVLLAGSFLVASTTVQATQAQTNAEILQEVTGKSLAELGAGQGKRLGTLAKDEGKLAEFQQKVLESKKARLKDSVAEGRITQEQADKTIERIQKNQASCDGTGLNQGNNRLQDGSGARMGQGTGMRDGSGAGGRRGSFTGNCLNN